MGDNEPKAGSESTDEHGPTCANDEITADIALLDSPDRTERKAASMRLWCLAHSKCPQVRRWLGRIAAAVFDSAEICRQLSLKSLGEFVESYDNVAGEVLPTVVRRMAEGGEPSEELRLMLVVLLEVVLGKVNGSDLEDHMEAVVEAITAALHDQFPAVKKRACDCVGLLTDAPAHCVGPHLDALVGPLLDPLSHRHAAVREAALHALGKTVLRGSSKNFGQVWSLVARRTLDSSHRVRIAAVKIAGDWITEHPDRHCHYPELVSIILSGVSDSYTDVEEFSKGIWIAAGTQYAAENETEMKKEMESKGHMFKGQTGWIGCRFLVRRTLAQLLPPIFNDLKDWKEKVRLKAAELLHCILSHAEEDIIPYVPIIIDGIANARCNEDDRRISEQVLKCASLTSRFTKAETWHAPILDKIRDDPCAFKLQMLNRMLIGSEDSLLQNHSAAFGSALLEAASRHMPSATYQEHLLDCTMTLIDKRFRDMSFPMFQVLLMLLTVADKGNRMMICVHFELLARLNDLKTQDQVFALYMKDVMTWLVGSQPCSSWNVHSWQFSAFKTSLLEAGPGASAAYGDIVPILTALSQSDKDPQLKFGVFQAVSNLTVRAGETEIADFAVRCLRDCVLPNLVWSPGKSASVTRAAAMSCLLALLQSMDGDKDEFVSVFGNIMAKTSGCLADDRHETRQAACQVLDRMMLNHAALCKQEDFRLLSSKLTERLGDERPSVRLTACHALGSCLKAWTTACEFDKVVDCASLETICGGLVLYLDDPEVELQSAALETLKIVSQHEPSVVSKLTEKAREKQKNKVHLDELTLFLDNLKM